MKKTLFLLLFLQANLVFSQNKNYLIECDKYYQEGDTTVCFQDITPSFKKLKYYKDDKFLYGKQYVFYDDSTFSITIATDKFGFLEGYREVYSKNRKKISIEPLKNGQIEGIVTEFDEEGRVVCKVNYHKGKEDGVFTLFWNNGQIYRQMRYKKGRIIEVLGVQDYYGKPLELGLFSPKKGHINDYDAEGKLIGVEFYKKGKLWDYRTIE